jgi:hypothetical protein
MGTAAVQRKDAPSPGAWGLRSWAKKYQHQFMSNMLPKALAALEQTSEEKEAADVDEKRIGQIQGLLSKVRQQAEDGAIMYCVTCGERLGVDRSKLPAEAPTAPAL